MPICIYSNTQVRVWASDSMALIPAGPFVMGNCMDASEGYSSELPVHTVMVSAFYMDKYEVTSQLWFEVRNWALANGYTFGAGSGKGVTHPIQTVSWYDCVKWCNARSEKEGLTPCYYTNAAQTLVYRGGSANLSNEWVKWTANGYRLPSEAEWEKAARGGAVGMRLPWSDANTITNSRANYYGNTGYAYDLGPNGYNPAFTNEPMPYTSPVGYFAPNGYGLYDLAGNVWEWCWDWYGASWYSNGSATQSDTCGPSSGSDRVVRGGNWDGTTYNCRVAIRYFSYPVITYSYFGFRCVRR
ncbi:MAG: SUMF1/EgtB/PvdO family nonheme iron enzyme [bacterium]|nr:SUMF1/EgtB/PvdO family nonheme iron enzyme [bacterium]